MDKQTFIDKVKILIARNQIGVAISELLDFLKFNNSPLFNDCIQLSARYEHLNKQSNQGVISKDEHDLSLSRIIKSLLDYTDEILILESVVSTENIMSELLVIQSKKDNNKKDWCLELKSNLGIGIKSKAVTIWDDDIFENGERTKNALNEISSNIKAVFLFIGDNLLNSNNLANLKFALSDFSQKKIKVYSIFISVGVENFEKLRVDEFKQINSKTTPLNTINRSEQNKIIKEASIEAIKNLGIHEQKIKTLSQMEKSEDGIFREKISNKRLTFCIWKDKSVVCTGFGGELYVVDIETTRLTKIKINQSIGRCLFSINKSNLVLTGFDDGLLTVTDLTSLSSKTVGICKSSIFSIIGFKEKIITSERNGTISEWKVNNATTINNFECRLVREIEQYKLPIFQSIYIPSRDELISVGGNEVYITNLTTSENSTLTASAQSLYCVTFVEPNTIIVGGAEGLISIYTNYTKKAKVHRLKGHTDSVRSIATSKFGKWLFSGSKDNTVKLWNLATKKAWLIAESEDYIYDVKVSSKNDKVAYVDGAGFLTIGYFGDNFDNLDVQQINSLLNV
jgi:WD40 repeat protein